MKEKEDSVTAKERDAKRKQGDKILDTIGMTCLKKYFKYDYLYKY